MATGIWTGATDSDPTKEANWNGITTFAAGDILIVPADATVNIDGADMTAEANFDKLLIEKGCEINIGSSTTNFKIAFTSQTNRLVEIRGIGRQYIEMIAAADIIVEECGATTGGGEYDCNLSGTDNTQLHFMPESSGARCGYCARAGESGEVDEVFVTDGLLVIGDSVTLNDGSSELTKLEVSGGFCICKSTVGDLRNWGDGGTLEYEGGEPNNVWALKGLTNWKSSAGIGTKLYVGGQIDFRVSMETKTVAACDAYGGAVINDPFDRVTWTTGIVPTGVGPDDLTLDLGIGRTITPG